MDVSGVINKVAEQASPQVQSTQKTDPSTMDKEDFLKLLIAQLENQDPLNPQDPTEFTSQLTEFSSLEQLMGINEGMNGLGGIQSSNEQLMAAGMIGKRALVDGDRLSVNEEGVTPIRYELNKPSVSTIMKVYDKDGKQVAELNLGGQDSAVSTYDWNGLDANGDSVAPGEYRFAIEANDANGDPVEVETKYAGIVQGVRFENGRTLLDIDGTHYTLSDVTEVTAS